MREHKDFCHSWEHFTGWKVCDLWKLAHSKCIHCNVVNQSFILCQIHSLKHRDFNIFFLWRKMIFCWRLQLMSLTKFLKAVTCPTYSIHYVNKFQTFTFMFFGLSTAAPHDIISNFHMHNQSIIMYVESAYYIRICSVLDPLVEWQMQISQWRLSCWFENCSDGRFSTNYS